MRINVLEIAKGCARGLLLALNALCMIISIFTFGFAVVDMRILKQYGDHQASGTFASDMVVIAICALLIIIAVMGCVGVIRENAKILYLYVGLLMILVILELLVGIFVAVQRCGLQLRVKDWLREDFFKNATGEDFTVHGKVWDDLQIEYECCGLNGPEDYTALQLPISVSCCPQAYHVRTTYAQQQMYKACIQTASYFREGCEEEVLRVLQSDADYLLGIAILSFWFEGAGMLLGTTVANSIKNSMEVYRRTVKY